MDADYAAVYQTAHSSMSLGKKQEIMQQEKHGCVEFLAVQTTQQIRYFDGLQYQIVSERSREK